MKLFTKIALGIAGFFAGIAVICMVIAFAMGFTTEQFKDMVNNGDFTFKIIDKKIIVLEDDDILGDDENNNSAEGTISKKIEQDCTQLELEYGAGCLEIYYGDVTDIQIDGKNVSGLKITVGGLEGEETLYIEGALDVNNNSEANLVIILPQGTAFKSVDMELGASVAEVDSLQAEEVSITVGAGEVNLTNLVVDNLDLEVGAGYAKVTELCVGNLNVETGVGQVDIGILGAESDYNYNIECGIGEVHVGQHSYSGVGTEQNITNSGAQHHMNIQCGIGAVNMHFSGSSHQEKTHNNHNSH